MTAFEEGTRARAKGLPLRANHYDARDSAYAEWAEGWKAADDVLAPKPKPPADAHLGSNRE